MTPAQARAFHAVAVAGSFTAAARALNLSQPTLTHQVKLIEQRYKVELFQRTGRGVRVTETGAHLLTVVRRMFDSYDEAVAFLNEVHGMRQGHLRVGSYEPFDVSRVLARFVASHPGIQITARVANSPELAQMLLDYDVDVAVLAGSERRAEFHAAPFRQPRLIVIAPRTKQWITRSGIRPAELAGQPLIVREAGSVARQAFERLLSDAGISRPRVIEYSTREGVLSAVAAGLGLSAVFDEGLLPEERIVRLPIRGHVTRLDVQLMYLAERRDNAPIRAFVGIARSFGG